VLLAIVCGFEWFAFAVATRSPAYTGPAQPGRKVPQFAARLADDTPFTAAELEKGTPTVMVFYRGHW
jgi:cytochrome oxidase Cu insertion factor (SCO1/SenC/PrrC family)